MIRTRIAALAATGAVLLLSACGTTEQPAGAVDNADATGGPVSVTDSRGKEIKLDAPATNVVALEWGEAEMLVTLGVMPSGVADAKGYGTWEGRSAALVKQLEKYVPVLVTKGSDAKDNLTRLREDFTVIATAVGKDTEAKQVLADFDAALAEGKKKIADAGGGSFVMADGFKDGNAISIRPFGKGALVSEIAAAAGLTNAWQGKVDKVWGLGQTDVEGLTTIKDKNVRFLYNASDGNDVFADGLNDNAIWKSLPFVKAGRAHKLTDGIWTFGGPKSSEQFLDELVKVYTS
ncbi:MAG: ABC transporter substrate-binding protein [Actinophytocola sp.]|nr:ABC transporter substrate-binding protein [Actinophytocola sp.]